MSNIKMADDFRRNYPEVEGAGILGEIVNKRWSEIFVRENVPHYPSFDSMALDVLVEDYNERHAPSQSEQTKGADDIESDIVL